MAQDKLIPMLRTLTEREAEVLKLRCQGLEWPEIARKLVISERTVYFHVGNIYEKLGLVELETRRKRDTALRGIFCPVLQELLRHEGPRFRKEPQDELPRTPSEDTLALVMYDTMWPVIDEDQEKAIVPWTKKKIGGGIKQLLLMPPKQGISLGIFVGLALGLATILGGSHFLPASSSPVAAAVPTVVLTLLPTPAPQIIVVTATPPPMTPTAISTPISTPIPATSTPLPTATPAPHPGDILYQADWSKGPDGWGTPSGWNYLNGMLINDGTSDANQPLWAPYEPSTPNYAVEAQIQVVGRPQPLDSTGFDIVARTNYELLLDYGCSACIYNNTQQNQIGPFRYGSCDSSWHTYRLEVNGNQVRAFIDGNLIAEGMDNHHLTPGQVGIWCAGAQINVRSFKVIAL